MGIPWEWELMTLIGNGNGKECELPCMGLAYVGLIDSNIQFIIMMVISCNIHYTYRYTVGIHTYYTIIMTEIIALTSVHVYRVLVVPNRILTVSPIYAKNVYRPTVTIVWEWE